MSADLIGGLVEAALPICGGIYTTLLGRRVIVKQPGADIRYDEWHVRYGRRLEILGPLVIIFGLFLLSKALAGPSLPMIGSRAFVDKHRVETRLVVEAEGSHLLGGSMKGSRRALWGVTIWMAFISCLGLALIAWLDPQGIDSNAFRISAVMAPIVSSSVVAILYAIVKAEQAKGLVIEVDQLSRVVTLPRDKREISFDDIQGVSLLIGSYEWTDEFGEAAELRLFVEEADEIVPVVMASDIAGAEKLAKRVAAMLDLPLDCDRMGRSERQRNVSRGSEIWYMRNV